MPEITIRLDPATNQIGIHVSADLAQNRLGMYGLLQMGLEMIHRMGDPPTPANGQGPSRIVLPTLHLK